MESLYPPSRYLESSTLARRYSLDVGSMRPRRLDARALRWQRAIASMRTPHIQYRTTIAPFSAKFSKNGVTFLFCLSLVDAHHSKHKYTMARTSTTHTQALCVAIERKPHHQSLQFKRSGRLYCRTSAGHMSLVRLPYRAGAHTHSKVRPSDSRRSPG
jgi:hypothetical protein